jgi:hypothetical protein
MTRAMVSTTLPFSRHQQAELASRAAILLWLKRGIWAYAALVLFEGALRKWVLPGLATPLLVIRDPLALWLIGRAWQQGYLRSNPYLTTTVLIGIVGTFTAVLLGHGSLPVAVYGARILLLHFPLVFIIGRLFSHDDICKLGLFILWISLGMTVLIALQFYSPQSAWVNRGIGGDTSGSGFSGALDRFRPSGTFSFTNGVTHFYGLLASFLLYFWFQPRGVPRWLLAAATVCLLLAIPLSISRGLFFQVGVAVLFSLVVFTRKPQYVRQLVLAAGVCIVLFVAVKDAPFFEDVTGAFFSRFETANEQEGGVKGVLGDRYLGGFFKAISGTGQIPFFGHGLGMGTNVGSMLLSGRTTFLISEEEWGRVIGELGPLLGLALILVRVGLCANLALRSYRQLGRNELLPWMLLSCALVTVPQAQWAQPTSLGFSTIIAGFLLAALRPTPPTPHSPA